LVALYSIVFRAFFDAKAHDWSFYLLVVVATAICMHRRRVALTLPIDGPGQRTSITISSPKRQAAS
jgi:hypothetical protein